MLVSAGGRPKLHSRPPVPQLHFQVFFQNFRLLNFRIIFSERSGPLEMLGGAFVISRLVERQGKIVVGLR